MPKTPDPETLRLAAEVLVDAPGLERGPTTDHCLEVAAWLVAQANLLEQQGSLGGCTEHPEWPRVTDRCATGGSA